MTQRYQYPAKAEPVLPEELRPSRGLDNLPWLIAPPVVRPPRRLVPQGEFGVTPPSNEIISPIPTFLSVPPPDPVRRPPSVEYLSPTGELVLDAAQRTTFARKIAWVQRQENPVVRPPSIEYLSPPGELVLTPAQREPAPSAPDIPFLQQPDPVRLPPPRQYQAVAELVIPESLRTTPVRLEWFRPASEPVRPPLRLTPEQWAGVLEPIVPETITMDKWWRQPEEPVRPKELRLMAYAPGGEAVRAQIIIGPPTFEQYGSIELPIDTGDHPDDAVYRFQGMMKSSSAVNSAQLRLFNVTDSSEVVIISAASTTAKFVQSNPLTLPSVEKTYRVDIGGVQNGGTYGASMAKLEVVAL